MSGKEPKHSHHVDTLLNVLGDLDPKLRQATVALLVDLKKATLPYHKHQHREYSDIAVWRQAASYTADPAYGVFENHPQIIKALQSILLSRALGIATHTCLQLEQAIVNNPEQITLFSQAERENLTVARRMIANVESILDGKGSLSADHKQYMSQHNLSSSMRNSVAAEPDPLAADVTADDPPVLHASKVCGKRTKQDGSPCARLLKPNGQCPYHG